MLITPSFLTSSRANETSIPAAQCRRNCFLRDRYWAGRRLCHNPEERETSDLARVPAAVRKASSGQFRKERHSPMDLPRLSRGGVKILMDISKSG
jgi:hypothetical protein